MARKDTKPEVQHYVPKFYLRGFLREPSKKQQICVFDKHEEKSFVSNISNIAGETSFYEFGPDENRGVIENIFSKLETSSSSAIQQLLEQKTLAGLSDVERGWLAAFIASQNLRTRHFREVIRSLNSEYTSRFERRGIDPKKVKGFRAIESEEELTAISLQRFAENIKEHSALIGGKACCLTTTTKDRPFWVSDHPVVLHNDEDFGPYGNIGLALPGIQIYMPLNSTTLLLLWCPTVLEKIKKEFRTFNELKARFNVRKALGYQVDHWVNHQIELESQRLSRNNEELFNAFKNGTTIPATAENVDFYNSLQVNWSHRYVMSPINNFELVERMIADSSKFKTGMKPHF